MVIYNLTKENNKYCLFISGDITGQLVDVSIEQICNKLFKTNASPKAQDRIRVNCRGYGLELFEHLVKYNLSNLIDEVSDFLKLYDLEDGTYRLINEKI